MRLKPFFVIRNSIHDCSLNDDADTVKQSKSTDGDNDSYEKQDYVSVVRLVEPSAKGPLMLDFDHSNEAQIEEFVESIDDSRLTYIDENNWQHLHAFATLVGRLELLNQLSMEETHGLLAGQTAPCFVLLKKEVVDVLSDKLSIERLFSWHVLKDARDRGDVQWKDIRKFLSTVRNEVPYLTKDGILKSSHGEPIHVTFLQFVAFSKLVHNHLSMLPRLSCQVLSTTGSSVDIKVESSNNCNVQIGVIQGNGQPPKSTDLQNNHSIFASWKSMSVSTGRHKIKIDSLEPNTGYSLFFRVDRNSIVSSDDHVLKSRIDFVTDCQPNNFPFFSSMSSEEQKSEILACIHDKLVRQTAPLIPFDNDKLVAIDECSEDWSEFIVWWQNNHDARTQFLNREVLFAASDAEIRRQAEQNGVSMKERKSKDPQAREAWSKRFNAWYFGMATPPEAQLDSRIDKPVFCFSPTIQHYEFTTNDNGEIPSDSRGFTNTIIVSADCLDRDHGSCDKSQLPSPDVEVRVGLDGDLDAKVDLNEEDNAIENVKDKKAEVRDLSDTIGMNINIKSMQPKRLAETTKSHERAPPLVVPSNNFSTSAMSAADEIDTTCEAKVGKIGERSQEPINAEKSNPDIRQKRMSVVETGIVGQVIRCNRREYLDKIRSKVQTARAKADQLTGRSRNLHGLALFRSAVRLVLLLQKISSAYIRRGFNVQQSRTMITENAFDLFEFADYDFNALNKTHLPKVKTIRYDPEAAKVMRKRYVSKLLKRAFNAMLYWKNNQMTMRGEMKAKVTEAEKAYIDSVLRRSFRKYRANVKELVEESLARKQNERDQVELSCESEVEVDVIESNDGTPRSEVKQPAPEEIVSIKFRENYRLRFTDQTPFTPHVTQGNIKGLKRSEYSTLFANGIELMQTHLMQSLGTDPIELYDCETLKRMKHDKLKAGKSSGVNIFDVPPDVLANSCAVEDGYSCTDYKMREKVKCIVETES